MSDPQKTEIVKGHCPDCGPDRFADVVGHHVNRFDDDEAGIWGQTDYRILQCRGCGRAYFQIDEVFSEDIDHVQDPHTGEWEQYIPHKISYWPSPSKRERPDWAFELDVTDSELGTLFGDIYGALNADLRVPAAIAARTVFDRASELLGIDPAITFAEKLDELADAGKISTDEKGTLEVLTDAGSAAAHRGWRPKPRELETMISIIEAFLHRTFVLGEAARELRAKIPPKARRKTKKAKAQSTK